MAALSYNDEKLKKNEARHLFWPDVYGFVSEAIIGVLALIVFNTSEFSNQLAGNGSDAPDPFLVWRQISHNLLSGLEKHTGVEQIITFGLWAIVGALIYVLVFRLLQIIFNVKHSVGEGVQYVRQDHTHGAIRWLASLHDFFFKALIVGLGLAVLLFGAVICFGIASQELNNGLSTTFPKNVELVLLSLVAAILSMRLIVLGISLLSRRFRIWYNS